MAITSTEIYKTIDHKAKQFESIFRQGNASGLAEFYSNNGMLLPAGFDFVQGKQEIETFWQEAINMGIKDLRLDIIEIEQHGDTAIEMSRYTMSDEHDQIIDQGKGIMIWKYETDGWKMYRDIWTSNIAHQ